MAQSLSRRTIDERIRVIRAISAATACEPEKLTPDQITEWLATKPAAITRWSYFTTLRAFFHWLTLSGRASDDPTAYMAAPKRPKYSPRPVPWAHIEKVLAGPLSERVRVMILLAAFAGLRVSEIAGLHGSMYDPATGALTVMGKGGQTKVVPLNSAVQAAVVDMPRRAWWFPSPSRPGAPMTGEAVGAAIRRAFAKHGVRMTAHQLRHSFGTALVERGVNLRVVQELMRHESIASTALYTRVSTDQQQAAVDLLTLPVEPEKD